MVQLVTRDLAGFRPVIILTRVGVHTGDAEYALVKSMLLVASRCMFGVRYRLLNGVVSEWNGTEVSCQPMSSTRNMMMLGLGEIASLA